jgi:hypothetical protein
MSRLLPRIVLAGLLALGPLVAGCTHNGNGDSSNTNDIPAGPTKGPSVSISPGPRGATSTSTPTGQNP